MKLSFFTFILVILMSLISYSCGKKNNTPSTDTEYASTFIQNLNGATKLRIGQEKSITQYSLIKQANDVYCDYWEYTLFTIKDIGENNLTLQTQITSELLKDNDSSCPTRSRYDGYTTNTLSMDEMTNIWKEFIQSKIDASYRCSKIKTCLSAKLVRTENQTIENRPYRLFVTEYQYSDGSTYILETLVSQSSLFEGVVDYILYDKKDNSWINRRIFNYSSI